MGGGTPIDVTGGVGGVAADCADIRAMAGRVGELAGELGRATLALHGYLLDPGIITAGAVDPGDLLCFQADLLDALDGPRGLTWCAAQLAGIDLELRAAAAAYSTVDTLGTEVHDIALGLVQLPPALAAVARELAGPGDVLRALEALVVRDPELADLVIDGLGLPGWIAGLSAAIPDGTARVTGTGTDRAGTATAVPRSLHDVLAELARRNDGAHGAVDVRFLRGTDGRRRVIVDITGTKTIDPLPGPDVTGLLTDGRAMTGQTTTYELGVLAAMRRAGVRKDDEVMIVGHSEGGLVAVTAARDAIASGEFDVTHVITAGSPIGLTVGELPSSVQVLALENRRDVIPHLDGVANPDRRNVTTVTGAAGPADPGDAHHLETAYEPIAAAVDASHNRSVRAFLHSAKGFLTATRVDTRTFVVTRS